LVDGFISKKDSKNSGPLSPANLDNRRDIKRSLRRPGLILNKRPHNNSLKSNQNQSIIDKVNPDYIKATRPTQSLRSSNSYFDDLVQPYSTVQKKPIFKKIFKRTFYLLLISGVSLGLYNIYNISKTFNGNPLGILKTDTKLNGEDEGLVNILLTGTSEDDANHGGAELTDSIMVLSFNTKNNTASAISVPRDFYADISDGDGYFRKINEAYMYGEENDFKKSGYPDGGIGNMIVALENVLNTKIQYYIKINYSGFKQAIDSVGGIELNIESSDSRGIYDPTAMVGGLKLSNGIQLLNGEQALALARARNANGGYGVEGSDFDRTANQRKMILALKSKAVQLETLSNPVKITKLLNAVGNNIRTNFTAAEIRKVYELSKKINEGNIKTEGLTTENSLESYTTSEGSSALIPRIGIANYSEVRSLFLKNVTYDPSNPLTVESPKVVILNASGIVGRASEFSDKLSVSGAEVLTTGNADEDISIIGIVDISASKTASINKLVQDNGWSILRLDQLKTDYAAAYPDADFVIIIGNTTDTNN
jgi:LCP family protein required for cell wall assembly